MTQHFAERDRYIAVEGIDAAMEIAKVLIKNDYEVHIELDDCDIYVVHYAHAKYTGYGNAGFYRITAEQAELLESQPEE